MQSAFASAQAAKNSEVGGGELFGDCTTWFQGPASCVSTDPGTGQVKFAIKLALEIYICHITKKAWHNRLRTSQDNQPDEPRYENSLMNNHDEVKKQN